MVIKSSTIFFFTALILISFFILLILIDKKGGNYDFTKNLEKRISSAHFVYFMERDDKVDTVFQEEYFEWLLNQLKIEYNEKIVYYKLKTRKQIQEITGIEANACVYQQDSGSYAIYTILPIDNHECVHLVLGKNTGSPPQLFNEGAAVAYQAYLVDNKFIPSWNGDDFHILARDYYFNNNLPTIDSLLTNDSFWRIDPEITYPVTGSFIRYLIDTFGIDQFKEFVYISDFFDSDSTIRTNFHSVYNNKIDSAWNEWIGFIEQYSM